MKEKGGKRYQYQQEHEVLSDFLLYLLLDDPTTRIRVTLLKAECYLDVHFRSSFLHQTTQGFIGIVNGASSIARAIFQGIL